MLAPAASNSSITTSDGASRMSSVRGLKASPQIAKVRPLQVVAEVLLHALGDAAASGAR